MKILFLGPEDSLLLPIIAAQGDVVFQTDKQLKAQDIWNLRYDFLVSYGYRHIIKKEVLDLFTKNNAINLHISYLPWNRGADPNLWSFIDHTPKGVTIHLLDEGIDTGKILCQRKMFFHNKDETETLESTYFKLKMEIEDLFARNWREIKLKMVVPYKQEGQGSYHKSIDKDEFWPSLKDGYKTTIKDLTLKLYLI